MKGNSKGGSRTGELEWLPAIAEAALSANNRVFERKLAFHITIAGDVFVCRPSVETTQSDRWDDLPLIIGEWSANIRLASSTANQLLERYRSAPSAISLSALQRRILLATAFEDTLAAFEQKVGQSVAIGQSPPATSEFKISVAMVRPGFNGYAEIWLPFAAVRALLPLTKGPCNVPNAWVENIPIAVRRCAGLQTVSWAELRGLRPGDIVMCDAADDTRQFAIVEDHLIASLGRDGALVTRWHALSRHRSQDMDSSNKHASDQSIRESNLEDLPVRLVFEVGRAEILLRELRQLDQGSILPVAATTEECVDIVANGHRIGRGSLIKVGNGLGVRIVQLVAHV